ncbi:MAG: hypothetical protein F7C32_02245 [Desulfurococcales archaeon]|nr:hypothetical protein [Desulfurococcales archaeon]
MPSLEEKLTRIEKLLAQVLERLERLEKQSYLLGEEARLGAEITLAFSVPVQEAISAARKIVNATRRGKSLDSVSRAIIEALAVKGSLSLRQLEHEVRLLRGSASRNTIKKKVRRLEELGIVRVRRMGRRMVISLASGEED